MPTQPGTLVLPEVRIPWWNTVTDREEVAIIPAQRYQVLPGTSALPVTPGASDNRVDMAPTQVGRATTDSAEHTITAGPWLYAAIVMFILWLSTMGLWWQTRRQLVSMGQMSTPVTATAPTTDETDLFHTLELACQKNDPVAAQKALLRWRQVRFPAAGSMDDIARDRGNEALAVCARELDSMLYSSMPSHEWQGAGLLENVRLLRSGKQKPNRATALHASLNPV